MNPPSPALPEVCLNLWWFLDHATQMAYRLSGRAYALKGAEATKLHILRHLAATDFYAAPVFPVPDHLIVSRSGRHTQGAIPAASVRFLLAELFEHVFRALAQKLPSQVRFNGDKAEYYTMSISNNPLCVTTCVTEYPDGRLVPILPSLNPLSR